MHISYNIENEGTIAKYYYESLYHKISDLVDFGCDWLSLVPESVSVLDVGCGRGENLQNLHCRGYKKLVGIDFDPKCVELSSQYAKTFVCNVSKIREYLKNQPVDITIASHVMEHVENPKKMLLDIQKIPSRLLLVAVPNLGNPVKGRRHVGTVNDCHICGWDAPHLKTLLQGCGFEIIRWERDIFLLPPKIRSIKFRSVLPAFVVKALEVNLLPAIHPFVFSHSLICLCENVYI